MEKGFKYAKLILDEPRAIYYSGQMLSGHIECKLSHVINYSEINVTFIGEANVFWTEQDILEHNGIRSAVDVQYRSHEEYFNVTQCISGGPGAMVRLDLGQHQIPFQYQIPYASPSSFSGAQGSVSYKVIAYIQYPDPTVERDQLEKAFEVVAPLDLNMGNDFRQPIDIEFEEVYSCCCNSDPMYIAIHIPATGFCPGQSIPITINANNETNAEIKKIMFQLVQKECYHCKDPQSDFIPPEEVLAEVKTGAVLSSTKREMSCDLIVPDIIAPNLENCSLIDVSYFIKMIVKLSACNDDLEDETEIYIGLVPLETLLGDRAYRHPLQSDLPQAPIPQTPTFTPLANINAHHNACQYPNSASSPPPSYPTVTATYPAVGPSYPTPGGPYPNGGDPYPGPYPTVTPYPSSTYPATSYPNNENIQLSSMSATQIGFVAPPSNNPYPPNNAPYPGNLAFIAPSAPPPFK